MQLLGALGAAWAYGSDPLELGKNNNKKNFRFFQSASDLRAIMWCDSAALSGGSPSLPSLPNDCYYDQPNGPWEGSATSNTHLIALCSWRRKVTALRMFPGSVPSINSLL